MTTNNAPEPVCKCPTCPVPASLAEFGAIDIPAAAGFGRDLRVRSARLSYVCKVCGGQAVSSETGECFHCAKKVELVEDVRCKECGKDAVKLPRVFAGGKSIVCSRCPRVRDLGCTPRPANVFVRPMSCKCAIDKLVCLACYLSITQERVDDRIFVDFSSGTRGVHGCARKSCSGAVIPAPVLSLMPESYRTMLGESAGLIPAATAISGAESSVSAAASSPVIPPTPSASSAVTIIPATAEPMEWECTACTFKNEPHAAKCSVCGFEPEHAVAGVVKEDHATASISTGTWTCATCAQKVNMAETSCTKCGTRRVAPSDPVLSAAHAGVRAEPAPDGFIPPEPWTCHACTFKNTARTPLCAVCGSVPYLPVDAGSDSKVEEGPVPGGGAAGEIAREGVASPDTADATGRDAPGWSCIVCLEMNADSRRACTKCGAARLVAPPSVVGVAAAQDSWQCYSCKAENVLAMFKCKTCGISRPTLPSGRWICPACTVENSAGLEKCTVCGCASPDSSVAGTTSGPKRWKCKRCTAINEPKAKECTACEAKRPAGLGDDSWYCGHCTFMNKMTETRCTVCRAANPDNPPPVSDGTKPASLPDGMWLCERCTCTNRKEDGACVACMAPPALVRMPSDLDPEFFQPAAEELAAVDELVPEQRAAVDYVANEARRKSREARPRLLARMKGMGFNERDLLKTLAFIRDRAPLLIHIHVNKMIDFLLNDTHYRNQFETRTSHGLLNQGTRTKWEDRLFNNLYHDAKPFDRVKYGVLNQLCDPVGVTACRQYGASYLQLKKARLRATFADMDSGSESATLATCEYYAHVLEKYNDRELRGVVEVATGVKEFHESSVISSYKEIQIHGEVDFSRHVEAIVVHEKNRSDRALCDKLKRVAEKHNVNILWMDDLKQSLSDKPRPKKGGSAGAGRGGRRGSGGRGATKAKPKRKSWFGF